MMLVAIIFRPTGVSGITVRPREEFGTIKTIDFQTRRLTIVPARKAKPLTLVWNSSTRFIENGRLTTVGRLKRGMQITAYYHSPFFGDRFATKILVKSNPLAETNARHHRSAVQDIKRELGK